MKRKRVTRYYCEYCGKGGQTKRIIYWHEQGCLWNPHHRCPVCTKTRDWPAIALGFVLAGFNQEWVVRAVEGCPHCVLAVLKAHNKGKPKKEHVNFWDTFDYKKALAEYQDVPF